VWFGRTVNFVCGDYAIKRRVVFLGRERGMCTACVQVTAFGCRRQVLGSFRHDRRHATALFITRHGENQKLTQFSETIESRALFSASEHVYTCCTHSRGRTGTVRGTDVAKHTGVLGVIVVSVLAEVGRRAVRAEVSRRAREFARPCVPRECRAVKIL
jgi:hypothetical protein